VKHFKQDLAQVEMERRAKRDPEQSIFHPAVNIFDPLRRSDGNAGRDQSSRQIPKPTQKPEQH
jgi:hypothetical protein